MTEQLKKRLNRTVTFLNSRLPEVQFLAVALPRGGPPEVYGDDPEAIRPLGPTQTRAMDADRRDQQPTPPSSRKSFSTGRTP